MSRSPLHLPNTASCAHSADVAASDGAPKEYIQLFPMGVVRGRDGRGPYRLDDPAHAQRVIDASLASAGSAEIAIDYDHQMVFGAKDGVGGAAPAAGWIKSLDTKPDGVWARVEWTDAAAAKIKAREYRYISPFFSFDKATGALTRIWNAGLVNHPNFTELAAVAAAQLDTPEMDLKAVANALGLAETATIEKMTAAAAARKAANDAKPAEIEAAAAAAKAQVEPDPKAFVPMAVYTELQARVNAIEETGAEAKATAAVDAAVKGGKITPAGRDHALKLYRADPVAFADFVGAAPVVLSGEAMDTAAARANLDSPLTTEEKAAASAIGVSEEAYLASKKQLLGAR
ncbi:MAG: phage protease [Caulobacteraceae bacterium]